MISAFSQGITRWLLRKNVIQESEIELYEFAAYSVVLTLIPIFLSIIIGIFLGVAAKGLLLIFPFILLRKYSGGYHLHSPLLCMFSSIALITLFLLGIKYISLYYNAVLGIIFCCVVFLSVISLCILSPIDSEERKLSVKETKVFKRIAISLVLFTSLVYIILLGINQFSYAISIGCGIVLTALLQLPCIPRFLKKRNNGKIHL